MLSTDRPPAVIIENVFKYYDSNLVLNGLHMTVEDGTIYGLLGPSGCGKTTILNCILGICGMDSGKIHLNIKEKSELGFMPQDGGLFGELSSEETFYFHGRINLMTEAAIKSRIEHLAQLLDLPKTTMLIKNISGGQQRRVSLAVALLHNPKLLLLDEPTVGLDPILRCIIWEYLKELVESQNKTIIITTHYIEEARFADIVGFMSNGTLLEEDSPERIMEKYNQSSLEETFLYLSIQNYECYSEKISKFTKDMSESSTISSPLTKISSFSRKRLIAQIIKNCVWFKRSYLIIIYLGVICPMMYSAIVYETIGRTPLDLRIGTVHAGGYISCNNQSTVGCNTSLGCRLVEHLQSKSYQVIEFSHEKDGLNAAIHNDIWALITFPLNFTSSIKQISNTNFHNVDDSLVKKSLLNISMDMSNSIIGSHIAKHIRDGYYEVVTELFSDCGWSAWNIKPPLRFNNPIFGKNEIEFTSYIFPGLIVLFPFLYACLLSMATILMEKLTGVIQRSIVSGLLWSEFIIAHVVVVLSLMFFNVAAQFVVIFGVYRESHRGHYYESYIITYLQGVCGMCCGIFIAAVCNVENLATQIFVTIMFMNTYISGAMWPLEGMHWIARLLSYFLPTTLPLESIRHVIDHGWSFAHFQVFKGVIFSILWSLLFLLLASHIMYRKTKILK